MNAKNVVPLRQILSLMKRLVLYLLLMLPMTVGADELTNILSGVYKPALLSAEAQDSILGDGIRVTGDGSVPRWRLEYENKQMLKD